MLNSEEMLDSEPTVETPRASLPDLPPARSRALRVTVLLVLAVLIAAGIVFWGINARIQTAAAVKETTRELAIPDVSVIHPKPGAVKDEVVLPGNIQAFTDSPIYARSSGYLKQWNVDIGGDPQAGQGAPLYQNP